ncbi:hypothetical protein HZU67_02090 [Apis mellifera carnica]|nr:hypothetical protein HZU67_02090 [Apis mellifera carnica]
MEEMEEEEEEALDPEKEEEIKRLKEDYFWTDMCDYPITYPELDESDEVDGTTHRYVSHKIYKEHRKIPRPRHFQRRNKDIYYFVMSLPKKSSSPIRKNPKQFDLEGAYEEWRQKQSEKKEKVILDQSKKRVSDVLKELAEKKKLQDAVTVSVALQAVYDQILLMLMDAKIRTDVHTFINVALIWALSELELSDRDFEQYSDIALTIFGLPEDFMFCSFTRKNILDIVKDGGMRKVLLTVYRVPFSPNIHTTLHPRLPWTYIGPSHQQGHAKFYPNTIERIGEILEYKGTAFDSTYISDVICFHFMDVSEESYIAYRRKIYLFELAGIVDHKLTENLFLQLVHFI